MNMTEEQIENRLIRVYFTLDGLLAEIDDEKFPDLWKRLYSVREGLAEVVTHMQANKKGINL